MSVTKIASRPSRPLTRTDLDQDGSPCTHDPDCAGVHGLVPECHPQAPVHLAYGRGVLKAYCAVCGHCALALLVAFCRPD